MIDDEYLEKIGVILDHLERRVTAIEQLARETGAAVASLEGVADCHRQSILNLKDRMTHETLSILDIIGDIQAKLDPIYETAMPRFGAFKDEISRFFRLAKRSSE